MTTAARLPRITRLRAIAVRFEGQLQEGTVRDYAELARLGEVSRARITQIMGLRYLSPAIQERILKLPAVSSAAEEGVNERQLRGVAQRCDWREQLRMWEELEGAGSRASPAVSGSRRAPASVVYAGEQGAILELDIWQQAQALLRQGKGGERVRQKPGALLQDLLRCGVCGRVCGSRMVAGPFDQEAAALWLLRVWGGPAARRGVLPGPIDPGGAHRRGAPGGIGRTGRSRGTATAAGSAARLERTGARRYLPVSSAAGPPK